MGLQSITIHNTVRSQEPTTDGRLTAPGESQRACDDTVVSWQRPLFCSESYHSTIASRLSVPKGHATSCFVFIRCRVFPSWVWPHITIGRPAPKHTQCSPVIAAPSISHPWRLMFGHLDNWKITLCLSGQMIYFTAMKNLCSLSLKPS